MNAKAGEVIPRVSQHSAGAVVLTMDEGIVKILLLIQNNVFYNRKLRDPVLDIGPSGKVNPGERLTETASREVKEEIGLELKLDTSFSEDINYDFRTVSKYGEHMGELVFIEKTRTYFLAYATKEQLSKIKLSQEHVNYMLLSLRDAAGLWELKRSQRAFLKKHMHRLLAFAKAASGSVPSPAGQQNA